MRRVLPSPVLSGSLLALWLLLTQSVAPASLLFGTLLALVAPRLTAALRPAPVRMRRPLVAVTLLARVVWGSLRANVAVMATNCGRSEVRSGFVRLPLDVRDPNALAALAMIVTATPGTAWAELAQDRVLAFDCLYLNAMLVVITIGLSYRSSTYFEVGLLIALLGFAGSTAMAKFLLRGEVIE